MSARITQLRGKGKGEGVSVKDIVTPALGPELVEGSRNEPESIMLMCRSRDERFYSWMIVQGDMYNGLRVVARNDVRVLWFI